ncbi:MAG: GNAT family N-acetyltransferase [Ignavibacteriaceae bacterium]
MIQLPETSDDFRQIARLHKEGLGHLEYYLSNSSIDFIQFFYETVSKFDSTVILVYKNRNGVILGFIFSSGDKNKYLNRFYKENVIKILMHVSSYIPTIRAVFRRLRREKNIDYDQELLYMAVHPEHRSKGIGTLLLVEVQNKLAEKYDKCFLQVHARNKKAHALYQSLGFTDKHRYHIGHIEKIVMWKKLSRHSKINPKSAIDIPLGKSLRSKYLK